MEALLLLALTLGVAFANGGNDISKGIATLVGSGVSDLRKAVLWGSLWTVAGGVLAAFVASGLVATFSGRGLLAAHPSGLLFPASVALGAIGWLLIATRSGLPVSTTHALLGALVGTGIASQGAGALIWPAIAAKAALPLAVSPLLSIGLMTISYPLIKQGFKKFNRYCVCLEQSSAAPPAELAGPGAAVLHSGPSSSSIPQVTTGRDCTRVVSRVNAMDSLHWVSSGATSLFRGLNDTPKILALGVLAAPLIGAPVHTICLLTALAMGAGSLLAGARVTWTLSEKVARIEPDNGFSANLVTALLVGFASSLSLPVSTTHVSTGAIFGIGLHTKQTNRKALVDILMAWIITLPVAALIGWGSFLLLSTLRSR